jgi:hypothetical protein
VWFLQKKELLKNNFQEITQLRFSIFKRLRLTRFLLKWGKLLSSLASAKKKEYTLNYFANS